MSIARDRLERLLGRLHGVRRRGPTFAYAKCPAHHDRKASLTVQCGDRVPVLLVQCHAGCTRARVLEAIGMTVVDLRYGPHTARGPRRVLCTYDYTTVQGVPVRKERLHPKDFRWQRRDPGAPTGWTYGLDGLTPLLYRLADLAEEPIVVINEGEKAADTLWMHGLAATCPPYGASVWREAWTIALARAGCRLAVVIADADRAGLGQARQIVASLTQAHAIDSADPDAALAVKLVRLDDLVAPHGDAYDCVAEHGIAALRARIDQTPIWTPASEQQARMDRARRFNRERQARWRARQRSGIAKAG